jgi:hypothetical protein
MGLIGAYWIYETYWTYEAYWTYRTYETYSNGGKSTKKLNKSIGSLPFSPFFDTFAGG